MTIRASNANRDKVGDISSNRPKSQYFMKEVPNEHFEFEVDSNLPKKLPRKRREGRMLGDGEFR